MRSDVTQALSNWLGNRAVDDEAARRGTRRDAHTSPPRHGVETFSVFEQWSDPHGESWTVSYPWRGSDAASTLESWTELRTIDELAICADGHTVDATEAVHCAGCDEYRCQACEVGTEMVACPLCATPVCGVCRAGDLGVCPRCADAERAPDLDDHGWLGWRTASGVTITVGTRGAMLRRADAEPLFAVPAGDIGDPKRVAMWSVAASRGLALDSGFCRAVTDDRGPPDIGSDVEVWRDGGERVEYAVIKSGSSEVLDDPRGLELQSLEGQGTAPPAHDEDALGVTLLLRELRQAAVPPAPSMLVQMHVTELSVITITEIGLRLQRFELWPGKDWQINETHVVGWELEDTGSTAARAVCSIAPVHASAELGNTSFLVEVLARRREGLIYFAPVSEGRTFGGEVAFRTMAARFGVDAPVGIAAGTPITLPPRPAPSHATLVESQIEPAFLIADATDDDLAAADELALVEAGWVTPAMSEATAPVLPLAVGRGLATLFDTRGLTRVRSQLIPRWKTTETWSGHGTTTRTVTIDDHASARLRALDDGSDASTDFGVCSNGHLHAVDHEWQCPACRRWHCRGLRRARRARCLPRVRKRRLW